MREISITFIGRLLTYLVFRKMPSIWGSEFLSLPRSITNLKNEKTEFTVAIKKYLNAHYFYAVDECLACMDDLKC
jgi:hypothetical protein